MKINRLQVGSLILTTFLALVASPATFVIPAVVSSDAGATSMPVCKLSSLKISATNGDGLHHGVEFIRIQNVGRYFCTLRGYPEIGALLLSGKAPSNLVGMYHSSPPGSTLRATDVEMSWAGGVNWSTGVYPSAAAQKAFVPPIISLPAKTGVASSTLNWTDGPNTGTCPAFTKIRIGLRGGSVVRPLSLDFADPLCYEFDVTPIVRGATGAMNITTTSGKQQLTCFLGKTGRHSFTVSCQKLS